MPEPFEPSGYQFGASSKANGLEDSLPIKEEDAAGPGLPHRHIALCKRPVLAFAPIRVETHFEYRDTLGVWKGK